MTLKASWFWTIIGYTGLASNILVTGLVYHLPVQVVGGALLLVLVLGAMWEVATMPTEVRCPHCGNKVVPRVKFLSGHLYLSIKPEEKQDRQEG